MLAGGGEGELRETRDGVEPTIVVAADDEKDHKARKQNTDFDRDRRKEGFRALFNGIDGILV